MQDQHLSPSERAERAQAIRNLYLGVHAAPAVEGEAAADAREQPGAIEAELQHYEAHFRGKTILCSGEDPACSDIWKFFFQNFERLGLEKIIATRYAPGGISYRMEFLGKSQGLTSSPLHGDGDPKSEECRAQVDEADVVVADLPAAGFREFLERLVALEKDFLVIGSNSAICCKEVFGLIQGNQLWLGVNRDGARSGDDGAEASWVTNLPHPHCTPWLEFAQGSGVGLNAPD